MSGISYGDGATKRAISKVFYQDGATKRAIQNAWIGDGGVNRQVYSAYTAVTATVSSTSVSNTGSGSNSTGTVSCASPTASGHNGTGSYTYLWEVVSGALTIAGGTADQQSCTVQSSAALSNGQTDNGVIRCLVSDGTTSAYTPNVSVSLTYTQVA